MLLFVMSGAAAAPPGTLVLPPGEDPGDWLSAARLAGLTLGPCAAPPCVLVEQTRGGWTLRAGTRALAVPVPGSEGSREEIAALAAGLVRDLTRPGLPPAFSAAPTESPPTEAEPGPSTRAPPLAVAVPGRPARVAPPHPTPPTASGPAASPRKDPPPQPAPNPASPAPPPAPPTPDTPSAVPDVDPVPSPPLSAEAPAPPPPTEPPAAAAAPPSPSGRSATARIDTTRARPTAWISAHSAWSVRGGAESGPLFGISGGLRVASVDLGVRGGASPARPLDATDGAGSMAAAELTVVATWAPPGLIAPLVGVEAGASWRWFAADQPVDDFPVPFVGCELGFALSTGVLSVAPHAVARIDLASTTIQRGDAAPRPLAPWDVGGGLSLRLHFP